MYNTLLYNQCNNFFNDLCIASSRDAHLGRGLRSEFSPDWRSRSFCSISALKVGRMGMTDEGPDRRMVSTRSGIDRIVPSIGGVVRARFTILHGQGDVPDDGG